MSERVCPLAHYAQSTPENIALFDEEQEWTYAACDAHVNALCVSLERRGVKKGSRVAFTAETKAATVFLFFALFRLQAIACPISFREPRRALLLERLEATHDIDPSSLALSVTEQRWGMLCEEAFATYIFTSGSSGMPKIVCHTLANHLYNAYGCLSFFSLDASARWLLSLPLFHVGGLAILFRLFLSGGAIILSKLPLALTLATHPITHVSLVPTQLYRLLQQKRTFLSVRTFLVGGASLSPQLCEQAHALGFPLIYTYGMTEMASLITGAKTKNAKHVGKPLPFRELTLSTEGEVHVKGPTLFHNYLGHPRNEGWFPTGDLGTWTEEGNLQLLGRKDRLFISGGENIYPEEIERALCQIEGILSATVIPQEDKEFGKRPVAYIQDTTAKHTLESVKQALKPLLPSFKHPVCLLPYEDFEEKSTKSKTNYLSIDFSH